MKAKSPFMKLPLIVSLAACGLALSACGNGNTGSEEANIADANQTVDEATPLPPAIADSRPHRCADGSVFFVARMSVVMGKSVSVRVCLGWSRVIQTQILKHSGRTRHLRTINQ